MSKLISSLGAIARPTIVILTLLALNSGVSGCTNTGANEPASDPASRPQTTRPRGSGQY